MIFGNEGPKNGTENCVAAAIRTSRQAEPPLRRPGRNGCDASGADQPAQRTRESRFRGKWHGRSPRTHPSSRAGKNVPVLATATDETASQQPPRVEKGEQDGMPARCRLSSGFGWGNDRKASAAGSFRRFAERAHAELAEPPPADMRETLPKADLIGTIETKNDRSAARRSRRNADPLEKLPVKEMPGLYGRAHKHFGTFYDFGTSTLARMVSVSARMIELLT